MKRINRPFILAAAIVGAAAIGAMPDRASADIQIKVVPSSAPNQFGSPSFAGWEANTLNALQNDLSGVGDRNTDPTAYVSFANGAQIDAGNDIVTGFPSWLGKVNPAAPFGSELGNRLQFGIVALGDGSTQFTLGDVNFQMDSNDPGDSLAFSGNLAGATYNGTSRIGIQYGPDHQLGGGDDVILDSGEAGTTPVDALYYVGVGNALVPAGSSQSDIDDVYSYIESNEPFDVTTSYTIDGNSSSAFVQLVPEPTSLGLLGFGGMALLRRRRK
jgi:hypothetical protein